MPPFRDDVITCFSDHHRFVTALRRIVSLDEKNVAKYAQQIAREALKPQSAGGVGGAK